GQGPPQRISAAIEQLLLDLDTGTNLFRMAWDSRYQGFHLFCTPAAAPAPTTHFFWEARTGAWWQQSFTNNDHNPVAVCRFEGNCRGDGRALLGWWDGFVRPFVPTATADDGGSIPSRVLIGPPLTADADEVLLKDVQAILGTANAAPVNYNVYVGASA